MIETPEKPGTGLTPEELRWLHDKYERLAAEEGQLAGTRTSYFATIGAVLVSAMVVVMANFQAAPLTLVTVLSFLAGFGIFVSSIWAVLLHRTTDAQRLYREAALRLEEEYPLVHGKVHGRITLRSGGSLSMDLSGPYRAHQERFSTKNPISWWDRVDPALLSEAMPQTLIAIWLSLLVFAWSWFLFLR